MRSPIGQKQRFNFRRHGDELAETLDRGAFLPDRHEEGLGLDASGELSVEPDWWVVRTPADLDANNDGGHAERSYCESPGRCKSAKHQKWSNVVFTVHYKACWLSRCL